MKDKYFVLVWLFIVCFYSCQAKQQKFDEEIAKEKILIVGAERIDDYISLIRNKSVAVVANQTSMVKETHLVDTLLALNVNVQKVFAPEHGFRGTADAGAHVGNSIDSITGIQIISLYGKNKKPTNEQLEGVDCVLFDIQDVGARFYTYISTLQYVMEAAADNKVQVIVLDRPNPNGFYVDGPVLDTLLRSFVGMNPIPIVHGLTIGEYAKMMVGENWLKTAGNIKLTIIPVENYNHSSIFSLPVKPSPNLPNISSIYLYPSLCLFEGTVISVGRGTDKPFQQIGHPEFKEYAYSFTPKSIKGAAENPKHKDVACYGEVLIENSKSIKPGNAKLNIIYLIDYYNLYKGKESFFNSFFDKLSGTVLLKQQIIEGLPEEQIRYSWQKDLEHYKLIRKKYLMYPDFE